MKNYSLLAKLVVCCALVVGCTVGLSQSPSYGQGRVLTAKQLDAIVTPNLAQCLPPTERLKSGQLKSGRIDPASVIPTSNAREFPKERIARTLHGMWRGQVLGDYHKDLRVDYFWIIDTVRNEGLIIAQRTGNTSTAGLSLGANAPKLSYLMCANEGYLPSSEGGSQIHEFVKVSDSIEDAPQVLTRATGVSFAVGPATLADMWKAIVKSGYFKSLPAVAFAGGLFKPMKIESVPSPIGPPQLSMSWDSEYYGGGATLLKFSPGVPMKGVEYTQFIGTTATAGDFLVSSPGNGKLAKVEASSVIDPGECTFEYCYPEYYDLAFDSVTFGPLQDGSVSSVVSQRPISKSAPDRRAGKMKSNHGRQTQK